MDLKYFIFGASKRGEELLDFIIYNSTINIAGFIDNSAKKHGDYLKGFKIYPAEDLKAIVNLKIIVASMYYEEISEQLIREGFIKGEHFITDHEFFLMHCIDLQSVFNNLKPKSDIVKAKVLFFVLPSGFQLGGIEQWSLQSFNYFKKKGYNSKILSVEDDYNTTENEDVIRIHKSTENFIAVIIKTIEVLLKYEKIVIFPNLSKELMIATAIIKKYKLHPNFSVHSVLHSDYHEVYHLTQIYASYIDKNICVSDEINQNLKAKLKDSNTSKIITCISPIAKEKIISIKDRKYSIQTEPIRIGYASRLENFAKRTSDLYVLIEYLDKKEIDYVLEIVGDGSLKKQLQDFLSLRIKKNILYLGKLENAEMYKFWSDKDILVNFSTMEGTSLVMLEGMSQGAVPIVTNVSGVARFVNEKTGFTVEVGDMEEMAEKIEYLFLNRDRLYSLGEVCIEKIRNNCDEEIYYDRLL